MNGLLTFSWTAGLALTVGSLALSSPAPWIYLGLGFLGHAAWLLSRELGRIARRSRREISLTEFAVEIGMNLEGRGLGGELQAGPGRN